MDRPMSTFELSLTIGGLAKILCSVQCSDWGQYNLDFWRKSLDSSKQTYVK